MNNDWLQINRVSGDTELYNTDSVLYLFKKGTYRRIDMKGSPPVYLETGDVAQSKTQLEVETFLGGSFVRAYQRDEHGDPAAGELLIPIKSLEYITKVGAVVEARIKGISRMEPIEVFANIGTEF